MRKVRLLAILAVAIFAPLCPAAEQISHPFQGVTLIHRTETSPRPLDIHVAIIDALAPGVRFLATPESPHANDLVVAQTTRSFITEVGAQLGINGDFYSSAGTFGGLVHRNPSNFAASLGNIYSVFEPSRPAFHIAANNVAHTVTGSGSSPNPAVSVWNAIGGSDQLLQNGAMPTTWRDPAFAIALHPRTAIGVNADRTRIALFVVDGRQAHSGGMNFPEMADMLLDYGMHWAINLDGGGSTTMTIADTLPRTLNRPSDGTDRPVANSLAVFARPTPPPIPDGAQLTDLRQQPGGYAHVGAQILSDQPNASSAGGSAIRIGYDTTLGKTRGVFSFDLAGIPSNATIHSVSLTLDAFSANGATSGRYVDLELYALDDLVVEDQVNWNRAATGNSWSSPGGDFAAPAVSSLVAQQTTGLKTFVSTVDFVAAAQDALLAGEPLGLLVAALDAEAWGLANASSLNMRFRSDDATIGQRPTLSVHYTLPITPGDFNEDGIVDAADYALWRKGPGAVYTPAHYQIWQSHFGETGIGSASLTAAPEPSTWMLLATCGIVVCFRIRRSID